MPFEIVRNDLTKMPVDAIVNPTNSHLYGRGGIDGAIHKIEGPWLKKETAKSRGLAPGKCLLTKAHQLPAANIIHTVGPVWKDGHRGQVEILKDCYKNALELAKEQGFKTIAFPLISSGSYGFPKEIALDVAVAAIGHFLLFNEMTIYLVVYDKAAYQISEALYASVEAYIDQHYVDEGITLGASRLSEEADYLRDYLVEEAFEFPQSSVKAGSTKKRKKSLEEAVNHLDESFSQMLLRLIDERGLKDSDVYKKANVTKQTFSKIRNKDNYNPSKQTALAFSIALTLNLDETRDLLLKAGYALSNSNRFDVIISYFIEEENYDIYQINEVLFHYDENLLGL